MPLIITKELAAPGMKVVRGPNWEWQDQDGGAGNIGTIIGSGADGWAVVKWDETGHNYNYRVGSMGYYDLAMYEPFTQTGIKLTDSCAPYPTKFDTNWPQKSDHQKMGEARAALEAMTTSINKSDSLIQKSNKDGRTNTNIRTTSTGAIKIRRPACKI